MFLSTTLLTSKYSTDFGRKTQLYERYKQEICILHCDDLCLRKPQIKITFEHDLDSLSIHLIQFLIFIILIYLKSSFKVSTVFEAFCLVLKGTKALKIKPNNLTYFTSIFTVKGYIFRKYYIFLFPSEMKIV